MMGDVAQNVTPTSPDGWQAVYAYCERIREARGWTKEHLYNVGKVSDPTYNGMKRGRPIKRADKRRALERGLDVPPGTIDGILAGHDGPLPMTENEVAQWMKDRAVEGFMSHGAAGLSDADLDDDEWIREGKSLEFFAIFMLERHRRSLVERVARLEERMEALLPVLDELGAHALLNADAELDAIRAEAEHDAATPRAG